MMLCFFGGSLTSSASSAGAFAPLIGFFAGAFAPFFTGLRRGSSSSSSDTTGRRPFFFGVKS